MNVRLMGAESWCEHGSVESEQRLRRGDIRIQYVFSPQPPGRMLKRSGALTPGTSDARFADSVHACIRVLCAGRHRRRAGPVGACVRERWSFTLSQSEAVRLLLVFQASFGFSEGLFLRRSSVGTLGTWNYPSKQVVGFGLRGTPFDHSQGLDLGWITTVPLLLYGHVAFLSASNRALYFG